MQYAQIVPDTKTDITNSVFTYKIPAELLVDIQIGSLVQIPFAGRKLKGLVLDIKKQKPQAAVTKKLRKIEKILVSKSYLGSDQIKLAFWLSKYYHSPLSAVLFAILPMPPLKKSKPVQKSASWRPTISQKDLLLKLRFYYFKKLIQKTLKNKKQTILLFPQVEMAKIFYYYFKKLYGEKVILYHSGQSKTEKWQNWQKILKEQKSAQIIIGSQIAIFTPAQNLGQIIIDSADNSLSFKQGREPRYDVRKVAEKLAQIKKAKIIFFTPATPLEFAPSIKNKKVSWLRPKIPYETKTQIVDLAQEYLRQNYDLISEKVKQKLIANFRAEKKSILFINKKGIASVVICQDCNYIFRCPKCDSTLTYHIQFSQFLICHNCNWQNKLPSDCPECRGANLRFLGGGTEKVEAEVKKLIPEAKILRIEKDSKPKLSQKYDVIVTTQKMFTNFYQPANLVAALQPDLTLNLPDFKSAEKTFQLLKWLKLYTRNDFIIQTHYPQHYLFQAILENKDAKFYSAELAIRKKENYPPFARLIKLTIASPSQKEAAEKAKNLVLKLAKINKQTEILGPAPAYSVKSGHKYLWQIFLKGQDFKNILEVIPADWKIDIDPVTLL